MLSFSTYHIEFFFQNSFSKFSKKNYFLFSTFFFTTELLLIALFISYLHRDAPIKNYYLLKEICTNNVPSVSECHITLILSSKMVCSNNKVTLWNPWVLDYRSKLLLSYHFNAGNYANTGYGVFKGGIQNYKGFWLKSNTTKGNCWILRIDVVGRCQKVPIFYFQSQFSMSKIIKIFLIFFPLENTHFLLLPLPYDIINLMAITMPNFWQAATTPLLKI